MHKPSTIDIDPVIYLAIELSASTWLVASEYRSPPDQSGWTPRHRAGALSGRMSIFQCVRTIVVEPN